MLDLFEIEGCLIVADALHCQKETAQKIIEKKGDCLLSVKDNQPNLKSEIADYVADSALRKTMDKAVKQEKKSGQNRKKNRIFHH